MYKIYMIYKTYKMHIMRNTVEKSSEFFDGQNKSIEISCIEVVNKMLYHRVLEDKIT